MKKFFLFPILILSIVSFGGYISYFDTTYGVGLGYGQNGWELWLGYPYIGTSFKLGWDFLGIDAKSGVDIFSGKRSWGCAELYVDLNVFRIDGGVGFGYDETKVASSEVLPTIGDISLITSVELNLWGNFGVKTGLIYPFLVYKYINEVEKSFIPPPAFTGPLPFNVFFGVDIEAAFFKMEFLYLIRFSSILGYPSPLFNMNNLQISIKLYQ